MPFLRYIFKVLLPQKWYKQLKYYKEYIKYRLHFAPIERRIGNKTAPINIVFMICDATQWRINDVYEKFKFNEEFNTTILICPIVSKGRDYMLRTLRICELYFRKIGEEYIVAYDAVNDTYFDAKTLRPDIIYYIDPSIEHMDARYYITAFPNALSVYSPYFFVGIDYSSSLGGLDFYNRLWQYFVECKSNLYDIRRYSHICGVNCVVTGYPSYDLITNNQRNDYSMWRYGNSKKKRILWTPHHSIPGSHFEQYSTFLKYSDYMLMLAEKYNSEIEIAMKPHPLLRLALYKHKDWGKEKTDRYFEKWSNGINTSLHEEGYVDLFCTSDAIINDCNSFLIEYLYTLKPALYLDNGMREDTSNQVGKAAYEAHYMAYKEDDIENFIKNVVLKQEDEMLNVRTSFYNNYLALPYGSSVSDNIVGSIMEGIHRKCKQNH